MTREIKLRGKRLDTGEWEHGSLVILNGRYFIFNDEGRYEVDPATVGQFTGRKDKNGREIYEDDIISYYSTFYRREVGVVVWDNLKIQFIAKKPEGPMFYIGWDTSYKEILGNIHDNPELIKNEYHD